MIAIILKTVTFGDQMIMIESNKKNTFVIDY